MRTVFKGINLPIGAIAPAGKTLLLCIAGAMANSILTDIAKHVIGWPRPNFMAMCQPNVTCDESNRHDYITDFRCLALSDEEELEDALKSFPSAHASFAAFMAFFLVMYIHERWKAFAYPTRAVFRPLMQLAILALYWW